ncbi:hypothetical protein AMK59_7621 [Oryctes borbonicus]|uniref:Uncharacterized protein n=1 Tax=Oryctes borbonicus TaxID=1629725 RepID=A0A0T6AXH3_9SCAR|nr:hypothetical protein AMK59_7621 [Oryctes borbonicus]
MSQKFGKKLRKRTDDEVDTCVKAAAEENTDTPEAVENGMENEQNTENKMTELEVNGSSDDSSQPLSEVREKLEQEKTKAVLDDENVNAEENIIVQNDAIAGDASIINVDSAETEKITIEKGCDKAKIDDDDKGTIENEMEPLVLETEDIDPELEFDEGSDIDSQSSSPIIRCRTRRSQARNIPTPKTPRTIDSNGDDKTSECSDKPSVVAVATPEVTDTESEVSVFKPVTDVYGSKKLFEKISEEEFDSFQNMSTKAIAGNDTTRNVDLSSYPDNEFEYSPFVIQSRERSVGETLKLLSARRSIKSSKEYTLQKADVRDYRTLPPRPKRSTLDKISGLKRKNSDSPDYPKRFKSEPPRLLSYISSPIVNIKNHFAKSEIPSSTPKLTGYKSKNVFDNTNVSKITLNETGEIAEKKWCTVI